MDAWQINKMLYRYFVNYEYRLNNSFIYTWESDFFCMSGSNYFVEVEVKVSRGDYFRDFDKDKHMLFKALHEKKTHYITHSSGLGDEICRYLYGELEGYNVDIPKNSWWRELHNGVRGYWVNDSDHVYVKRVQQIVFAPATRINFHSADNQKCPNQLYFACPDGLIKLSEIPAYAGLIYCSDEAKCIRRAPYLHKIKQDMTAVLLKKFYQLWEYKVATDKKMEVTGQYNLFNQNQLNNE